ncbi:S-layer homology domain-containing protein [Paenibacillus oryzisoli]|uniref:S-layer protein n=1 Tax=Paenibacillus oryzisoli TaxID=1850517 RepID=A0A198AJ90_9BACL|nr:S-layer homology domain-containing protein [Paenibacillus oryzisoli]OAS21292.1 hypothetical protein A8708_30930 [Paenibacillus oryzisoli]
MIRSRNHRASLIVLLALTLLFGLLGANLSPIQAEGIIPYVSPQRPIEGVDSSKTATVNSLNTAAAISPIKSLSFSQGVSDWLADWNAGYLYAVSKSTNKLYFIRTSDMTIQKELIVGSSPTSIARNGNTLFIALSGATLIQPVDLSTQSLLPSIAINVQPLYIGATSDYLFYTSDWKNYSYNRSSGTIAKISSNEDEAVFAADEATHTIYIGETSSSGSKLNAYTYLTNTLISSSNYDGGYGFGFPNPKIFFDGSNVFFGGSKMNAADLTEINGAYKRYGDYSYLNSKILDVAGRYVLTSQAVFDKDTGVKLADLPYEVTHGLLGDNGTVYLYDSSYSHSSVESFTLDLTHPYTMQTNSHTNFISTSDSISAWTTDDSTPYIYAVSKATNECLVIRKSDMTVIRKQVIGANPTDIKLQNGKLYIALRGETHIAVVDASSLAGSTPAIIRYSLGSNPDNVYPADHLLYYWGQYFVSNMRVYDSNYGSNRTLADKSLPMNFNFNGAFYETVTGAMYGSGSVTYGSPNSIFQIDPATLTGKAVFNLDFWTNVGRLFKDGDQIYYGNKRYSVTGVVYGTYPDQVIYAKDSLVFGSYGIYDRGTFLSLKTLPFTVTNAYVTQNGEMYISSDKSIYHFTNLSDIDTYVQTHLLAQKPVLWDSDTNEKQIGGHIYFKPAQDSRVVSNYVIAFLNNNQQISGYIYPQDKKTLSDGTLDFILNTTNVPDDAVSLGIFSLIQRDNYTTSQLNIPVVFPLWDSPTYLPVQVTLTATKDTPGEFIGTLQWQPAKKETSDAIYRVYYINDENLFGTPLVELATGQPNYTVPLDLHQVPASARGFAIVVELPDGRQPYFVNTKIFPRNLTPKLLSSSIKIIKNSIVADTVTVNNLLPGDHIRVYNGNGYLLGEGTAGAGLYTVTVNIDDVGPIGSTIFITNQSAGKAESDPVSVQVPPATGGGGGGSASDPYGLGADVWSSATPLHATNVTSTSATLAWALSQNSANVKKIRVYLLNDHTMFPSFELKAEIDGLVTSFNLTDLSPDTTYTYVLQAGDSSGHWGVLGAPSVRVTTKKPDTSAPTWSENSRMTVANITTTSASLNWTPAYDDVGVAAYKLYTVTGTTYQELATVSNGLQYNLSNLKPSTSYTYAIKAVDAAGNGSDYGPAASFTTNAGTGGGGGGGGGFKPTPTLDKDGKMALNLNPDRVDFLVDLKSDKKELNLDAQTGERVDKLSIKLDADILQMAGTNNKPLVITSNNGTLRFPPNSISIKDGKNQIELEQIIEAAPAAIPQFKAVSSLVIYHLTENGEPVGAFTKPVQATFKYDTTKVSNPDKLGVYVLDEQTGEWNRVDSSIQSAGTITASLPHFSTYAVLEKVSDINFLDIQGHWAQKEIEHLVTDGIIDGMDASSFKPDNHLTRAQFVSLLSKALKLGGQAAETADFDDISSDSWYKDSVYAAQKAGIVSGINDHTFAPESSISREQMAVMMVKAYLYATKKQLTDLSVPTENSYSDNDAISEWAKSYVKSAAVLGIMNGYDEQHFAPSTESSRAQAAVVINRLLQIIAK